MRIASLIAAVAFATPAIASDWRLVEAIDSMTDARTMSAQTVAGGYVLALSKRADGAVWLTIHVPPPPHPTMAARAPMLRVDRQTAIDIQDFPEFGPTMQRQRINLPRLSAWRLGANLQLETGILNQIVTGSELRVRLYLDTGETTEVLFDLRGARAPVEALLKP